MIFKFISFNIMIADVQFSILCLINDFSFIDLILTSQVISNFIKLVLINNFSMKHKVIG